MEKSKFAYYVDEIVRSVAIWLICAICLRYVISELYLIVILATAISMLITLLIRLYYAKKNLTRDKIRKTDEAMCELLTADRTDLCNRLAAAVGGTPVQNGVYVQNTFIYPYFCGKFTLEKLNDAYNSACKHGKRLLVLCCDAEPEVEKRLELFSDIGVSVLKRTKSYAFMQKFGLLPATKKRTKRRFSPIKSAISKSKIKGYLITSVVLLVSAAFSPYSLLCIIAAAFNIAMSILCEVKGK